MGLTKSSTGLAASEGERSFCRSHPEERIIALAGNPNVGKSTIFNALTGLRQHTGNWPGKTVANAQGRCGWGGRDYLLVDIPGAYSLLAHSAEEEVARNFLCFGDVDGVVVVCDATCLERNLNLALQVIELGLPTVVCVNLLDEAERKGIEVDLAGLEMALGTPVVGAAAGRGQGLDVLMTRLEEAVAAPRPAMKVAYPGPVEDCVARLEPLLGGKTPEGRSLRWTALRLLEGEPGLCAALAEAWGVGDADSPEGAEINRCRRELERAGMGRRALAERLATGLVHKAEEIAGQVVSNPHDPSARDRRLDRLFISRRTGVPVMLLLLAGVFWLTIVGANYPSQWLSTVLFGFQDVLTGWCGAIGMPDWLHGALVLGMYRTLAWVVSVMLPPMAIFFPLFTLLEDFGYLPRVAFVLDHAFRKANACGKQALTMSMGFGCNAAGIVGCRIIDSPRERLIAMLTNNFVPCNGRLPTLIAIITMFFAGAVGGLGQTAACAALLTGVILLGVLVTFWVSRLLSATLLKGEASAFTLELPPYRRPQVGQVIVRSVLDRTVFVLGRAAAVAAPAGLLIWAMANVTVGESSLLVLCTGALDPFGRLLGLDGVILMAFILGLPANEIVMPIVVMAYLSTGTLTDLSDLNALHSLLTGQGWTWLTAVCTMLFSLMHWPCSTACLTVKRETGSWKWTVAAAAIPTAVGMAACFTVATLARLLGLI